MSSSSSSAFGVTCPGCRRRLRFLLEATAPLRVRIQCSACKTVFAVRRPGAPPSTSMAAAASAPTLIGTPTDSLAAGAATAAEAPLRGPAMTGAGAASAVPPSAGPGSAAGAAAGTVLERGTAVPIFGPGELVAGRYRVVRFLAHGGMGEVYEVEDLELQERVALKTVRTEVAGDGLAIERFRREIQLARKVTHPNVCRIFDVSYHYRAPAGRAGGDEPEIIFLTMELLAGETLAQRLRRAGPLPAAEALPIARQIAQALEAAHQAGIVHRDLKPGNVVLVPNRDARRGPPVPRAVVTDFGLARLESGLDGGALTLTTAGGIVGTPAYLAPEQLEGGEITTAVDIYALGIVLYEMATGTVPFLSDSVLTTAVRRLKEQPVSPRVYAPGLDLRWEAAILRCLARDPAARFASPLEVAAALAGEAAASGQEDPAPSLAGPATIVSGPAGAPAGGAPRLAAGSAGLPGPAAGSGFPEQPELPDQAEEAAAAIPRGGRSRPAGRSLRGMPPVHRRTAADLRGVPAMVDLPAAGIGGSDLRGEPSGECRPPTAGGRRPAVVNLPAAGRRRATMALVALILAAFAVAYYRLTVWRARQTEAESVAGVPSGEITPRRSVAVLGFKDLSSQPGTAWLSPALAEMLSTELGVGGVLRVIAGEDVARMKVELKLGDTDSLARDTLERIRKVLGSDAVVLGSYVTLQNAAARQIRLDVRLQSALSGETTTTVAETGTENELFGLVSRVGERLRHELGGAGTAAAPAGGSARAALPSSPAAARLYSEGLSKLRLFDPVGGRDLLVQAVAADPRSAPAHSALAAAWSALGHEGKAREEARTAFELAANLPQEERLVIEGRYRETVGEWPRAIEIYRRLRALYPDSVDHGLRLAAAQTAGGQSQDALATAAALHALPPPLGDDPRIDLAEAAAAGARSDFKRQRAAAGRAATRGEAQGASLLVAQARLLECSALRNLGEPAAALAACAEGQRLHVAAGNRAGMAEALTHAGNVLYDRGDLPGAARRYEEALDTYREIGSRGAEAAALNNIAVVCKRQGDLDRARQLYEQVLAISREIGSRGAEAYALNNLAGVLLRRGELDGAGRLYGESLAIRRELGDLSGEAYALDNQGVALRRRGELAAALRRHEEALALRRRIGQKIGEVGSLNNLGSTLLDRGELAAARGRFEEALATCRAIGSQTSCASALFGLGEVAAKQGNLAEARRRHEAALGLRTTLGEKATAAESKLAMAELDLGAGDASGRDRAAAHAEAAAQEFARQGAADSQALALSLGALAANAGGNGRQAQQEIARASALVGGMQDLRTRLTVALRAARLRPANEALPAAAELRAVAAEAARAGLLELRLEADLALAEAILRAAPAAAAGAAGADHRTPIAALEIEARAKGFGAIANRCAALLAATAPRQGAKPLAR